MNFLKTKVWPVVGGFVVAAIIMLFFEWINHFFFPKPAGLDVMDDAAVQAFTASLPWTAYILIFLGWAIGAFEGGCTTAWLSGEQKFRVTAALAVLLLLVGIFDMYTIGFPPVAFVIGLLILAIFPRLGHLALLTFEAKKKASIESHV